MLLHTIDTLCLRIHVVLLWLIVRLAGSGSPYEGRLEVYYSGEWGTVCDDLFDDVDATVACNSLNFRLVHYFISCCAVDLRVSHHV